jgi:hypothetical protein
VEKFPGAGPMYSSFIVKTKVKIMKGIPDANLGQFLETLDIVLLV